MKQIVQESSLYPNLIDLETDLSPPRYAHPLLPPQVPQISSRETQRDTNPRLQPRRGAPPRELEKELAQGTRERTRGALNVADEDSPEAPTSTVQVLPVRAGPARPDGEQMYQYWPFSTMIVSSCYKCFSPQKNANRYCRKHRKMFQG